MGRIKIKMKTGTRAHRPKPEKDRKYNYCTCAIADEHKSINAGDPELIVVSGDWCIYCGLPRK